MINIIFNVLKIRFYISFLFYSSSDSSVNNDFISNLCSHIDSSINLKLTLCVILKTIRYYWLHLSRCSSLVVLRMLFQLLLLFYFRIRKILTKTVHKNKTTLALNKAEWSLEKRAKNMQLRTSELACNGVAKVLMATNPPNNSSNPGKRTTKLFPLSLEYCIGFEFQISYIIWIESVGWTN